MQGQVWGAGRSSRGRRCLPPSHRGRREQGAQEVSSHPGPNRRQGFGLEVRLAASCWRPWRCPGSRQDGEERLEGHRQRGSLQRVQHCQARLCGPPLPPRVPAASCSRSRTEDGRTESRRRAGGHLSPQAHIPWYEPSPRPHCRRRWASRPHPCWRLHQPLPEPRGIKAPACVL